MKVGCSGVILFDTLLLLLFISLCLYKAKLIFHPTLLTDAGCTHTACSLRIPPLVLKTVFRGYGLLLVPGSLAGVRSQLLSTVLIVLYSEWTWTCSPPGARLCVTWVQAEVWFQGCSPICWQEGGAPVREVLAFPQTPLPLNPPPRRSWRRITTGAPSTPDSISTSMDTQETPTVSSGPIPVLSSPCHSQR